MQSPKGRMTYNIDLEHVRDTILQSLYIEAPLPLGSCAWYSRAMRGHSVLCGSVGCDHCRGPGRICLPRQRACFEPLHGGQGESLVHPHTRRSSSLYCEPSPLKLNGFLFRGEQYLPGPTSAAVGTPWCSSGRWCISCTCGARCERRTRDTAGTRAAPGWRGRAACWRS